MCPEKQFCAREDPGTGDKVTSCPQAHVPKEDGNGETSRNAFRTVGCEEMQRRTVPPLTAAPDGQQEGCGFEDGLTYTMKFCFKSR